MSPKHCEKNKQPTAEKSAATAVQSVGFTNPQTLTWATTGQLSYLNSWLSVLLAALPSHDTHKDTAVGGNGHVQIGENSIQQEKEERHMINNKDASQRRSHSAGIYGESGDINKQDGVHYIQCFIRGDADWMT